jgi:hypothetical protein
MFYLKKIVGGRMNVPEPEKHVAGADITPGMALKFNAGKLIACIGATAPEYIAHGSAKNGEDVAVFAVAHDMVFEVPCSAAPSSLAEGQKVTIGTDALTVTATTTDGVATIISLNGATKAGDTLVVKF